MMQHSTKLINQVVRGARICPVTGNLPTEMSEEDFCAACDAARKRERGVGYCKGKRKITETWCDTCQGKNRPKGLKIVSRNKALAKRMADMRRSGRRVVAATADRNTQTTRRQGV